MDKIAVDAAEEALFEMDFWMKTSGDERMLSAAQRMMAALAIDREAAEARYALWLSSKGATHVLPRFFLRSIEEYPVQRIAIVTHAHHVLSNEARRHLVENYGAQDGVYYYPDPDEPETSRSRAGKVEGMATYEDVIELLERAAGGDAEAVTQCRELNLAQSIVVFGVGGDSCSLDEMSECSTCDLYTIDEMGECKYPHTHPAVLKTLEAIGDETAELREIPSCVRDWFVEDHSRHGQTLETRSLHYQRDCVPVEEAMEAYRFACVGKCTCQTRCFGVAQREEDQE